MHNRDTAVLIDLMLTCYTAVCYTVVQIHYCLNLCNQNSHYKFTKYMISAANRSHHMPTTKSTLSTVGRDEWDTKEGTGKSMKNA